ncbi:MAG: dephospho-CoA kinase [Victivallales bacterium]|nr:dephospho-CoA kinase [Victivallales bacterium]MCF7889516.1 dephospho-CoA kinase [Victivallales bacterium]
MASNYLKIGLTGGIGCGKSTVSDFYKSLNCIIVDTDKICHEIYTADPGFKKEVFRQWGDKVLDENNEILRKEIAKIVFNDKKELKWLNNLIHPLILEKAESKVKNASSEFNFIIFDVPLLYEVGWEDLFEKVISVWSPQYLQQKRLRNRNWSIREIDNRIRVQYSNDYKLAKADYGIINSGSLNLLKQQCKFIFKKLMRLL